MTKLERSDVVDCIDVDGVSDCFSGCISSSVFWQWLAEVLGKLVDGCVEISKVKAQALVFLAEDLGQAVGVERVATNEQVEEGDVGVVACLGADGARHHADREASEFDLAFGLEQSGSQATDVGRRTVALVVAATAIAELQAVGHALERRDKVQTDVGELAVLLAGCGPTADALDAVELEATLEPVAVGLVVGCTEAVDSAGINAEHADGSGDRYAAKFAGVCWSRLEVGLSAQLDAGH